jgi:hypothetical protein
MTAYLFIATLVLVLLAVREALLLGLARRVLVAVGRR